MRQQFPSPASAAAPAQPAGDMLTQAASRQDRPLLHGLATFIELRQLNPNVKAILCGGYNEQDATQRFVGQGLAGFIHKPYDLDRLRSELEKVLPESV
jgi:DNA-binding NtrC family response regulator